MVVEFLGARLSSCSSLLYLGGADNYLYYSSTGGDSYILSVLSESIEEKAANDELNPSFNLESGIVDRPYVKIIEEHQSLAPIIGLEMRRNWNVNYSKRRTLTSSQAAASVVDDKNEKHLKILKSRNHRSELLVLSGANHTSHINLIQSGISIK